MKRLLLTAFLCLPLLLKAQVAYWEPLYKTTGDTSSGVAQLTQKSCTTYTNVVSSASPVTWTAGWYVVSGTVNIAGVKCSGNVHLILTDNARLTVTGASGKAGIDVTGSGNSLSIYAQSTDSSLTGRLTAIGGTNSAGIGGSNNDDRSGGFLTVNGGYISAKGDNLAAGIGGAMYGDGKRIVINGGFVRAQSKAQGAGIGGGDDFGHGLNIIINGGDVIALGGVKGAGIGGGQKGKAQNIRINGGRIVASGGSEQTTEAPGVGADGIGRGYGCNDDTVSSQIFFADGLTVKADVSTTPPTTLLAHSAGVDAASNLSGKRYVSVNAQDYVFWRSGNWNVSGNWSSYIVPESANDAVIQATCTIPAGFHASCKDLIINNELTLAPTAVLSAANITNTDATRLKLLSDASNSASVHFTSGTPKATVMMTMKGKSTIAGGVVKDPEWQYRGFIGTPDANQSLPNLVTYRWDESKNATSCWVGKTTAGQSSSFLPWAGYAMANWTDQPLTLYYTTTLGTTSSYLYNLTRTTTGDGNPSAPNCGVNLLTNSISAPVDLTKSATFTFNNVEPTFYFFLTRSHDTWQKAKDQSIVAYPAVSGKYLLAASQIPAGASFAVRVSPSASSGSLTIPQTAYLSASNGPIYLPSADEVGIISVRVETDSAMDELFLIESPLCGKNFDPGYDGTKLFASALPQVYATNGFGLTAVNADNSLLGQYVGLRGVKGRALLSLSIRGLSHYTDLYLYDRATGLYTRLDNDTVRYQFSATEEDEPQRFQICGRRNDGTGFMASTSAQLRVVGHEVWLMNLSAQQIEILDAAGNILWRDAIGNRLSIELPLLPHGIYFIHCGGITAKYLGGH